MTTFPEWAPPDLVCRYHWMKETYSGLTLTQRNKTPGMVEVFQQLDMMERLLSHHRMQRVWKDLVRYRREYPIYEPGAKSTENTDLDTRLFSATRDAWRFSQDEQKTLKEKTEAINDIKTTAVHLASVLNQHRLNKRPLDFFTEEELKNLFKNNYFQDHLLFKYLDMNLSQFLLRVAEQTETALDEITKESVLIDRPGAIKPRTLFIRHLYHHFWLKEFGQPLYRTFARYCATALDDDELDDSVIKSALKGVP